jgi:dsRNA-specific ribonuclease
VLDEKGPDHSKCFEVAVEIDGKRYASCWGASKKAAEQQAALNALGALGVTTQEEDGHVRVVAEAREQGK